MTSLEDFERRQAEREAALGPVRRWLYHRVVCGFNGLHAIKHPLTIASCWWGNVRGRYNRGRRGYDITDTYGLDAYLLGWLPDAIADLRAGSFGHPPHISMAEWIEILDVIESGLRRGAGVIDDGGFILEGEAADAAAEFEEAWNLMGKWFFHLWN